MSDDDIDGVPLQAFSSVTSTSAAIDQKTNLLLTGQYRNIQLNTKQQQEKQAHEQHKQQLQQSDEIEYNKLLHEFTQEHTQVNKPVNTTRFVSSGFINNNNNDTNSTNKLRSNNVFDTVQPPPPSKPIQSNVFNNQSNVFNTTQSNAPSITNKTPQQSNKRVREIDQLMSELKSKHDKPTNKSHTPIIEPTQT